MRIHNQEGARILNVKKYILNQRGSIKISEKGAKIILYSINLSCTTYGFMLQLSNTDTSIPNHHSSKYPKFSIMLYRE